MGCWVAVRRILAAVCSTVPGPMRQQIAAQLSGPADRNPSSCPDLGDDDEPRLGLPTGVTGKARRPVQGPSLTCRRIPQ